MSLQAIPGYALPAFGDTASPAAGAGPDLISPGPPVATTPPSQTPPFMMPADPSPLAPIPTSAPQAPAAATTDPTASRRAGAAIVCAGIGIGTGALLGGLWGAGSGLLFAGAAMNAYRARSLWASDYADDKKEAVKTTVMAVVGIGVAGYLGYKAKQKKDGDD